MLFLLLLFWCCGFVGGGGGGDCVKNHFGLVKSCGIIVVQIIFCPQFGTNPLPELMLNYCQVNSQEQNSFCSSLNELI